MPKGNVVDLLLAVENEKFERPTKEVEIKRLSKLAGKPVKFLIQAITNKEFEEIQDNAVIKRGKAKPKLDVNKMQLYTILKGVIEPNFKLEQLREKFEVPTPIDVIEKMLLSGEISKLYEEISEISGFGKDAVGEVKN